MKPITLVLILIALCCFVLSGIGQAVREKYQAHPERDCPPIPREQSTGDIRCWSGGELVYGNYIYHNGGVLCSTDGKEIKITGGKSLCVIESQQDNVWAPPIPNLNEQ